MNRGKEEVSRPNINEITLSPEHKHPDSGGSSGSSSFIFPGASPSIFPSTSPGTFSGLQAQPLIQMVIAYLNPTEIFDLLWGLCKSGRSLSLIHGQALVSWVSLPRDHSVFNRLFCSILRPATNEHFKYSKRLHSRPSSTDNFLPLPDSVNTAPIEKNVRELKVHHPNEGNPRAIALICFSKILSKASECFLGLETLDISKVTTPLDFFLTIDRFKKLKNLYVTASLSSEVTYSYPNTFSSVLFLKLDSLCFSPENFDRLCAYFGKIQRLHWYWLNFEKNRKPNNPLEKEELNRIKNPFSYALLNKLTQLSYCGEAEIKCPSDSSLEGENPSEIHFHLTLGWKILDDRGPLTPLLEKASEISGIEDIGINSFQTLNFCILEDLPQITGLYDSMLTYPDLESLNYGLPIPNLNKLHATFSSLHYIQEVIQPFLHLRWAQTLYSFSLAALLEWSQALDSARVALKSGNIHPALWVGRIMAAYVRDVDFQAVSPFFQDLYVSVYNDPEHSQTAKQMLTEWLIALLRTTGIEIVKPADISQALAQFKRNHILTEQDLRQVLRALLMRKNNSKTFSIDADGKTQSVLDWITEEWWTAFQKTADEVSTQRAAVLLHVLEIYIDEESDLPRVRTPMWLERLLKSADFQKSTFTEELLGKLKILVEQNNLIIPSGVSRRYLDAI